MENETIMTDPDDRDGQTCTKCGAGYYTETSIQDDWDGVLHCNNKKCNHEVKRYKSEEVFVSPKTQYILDAYESATDKYKALAAVLRALVNQGDCMYDPEADHQPVGVVRDSFSLAIADELEAI
jgi:nitrate reductase beta subunit